MRRTLSRAVLVALATFAVGSPSLSAAPTPREEINKPIDLVICLDVSGSMNGLIASAKLRLWDIVNELARVKPTPDLRVALYTYGATAYDPQKGWVRKELDLTADLDDVYKALNGLHTGGGTELVARVTQAALNEQKWNTREGALKIIFVCGNESAEQDKQVSQNSVAELAKKQGVVVNTIYCGRNGDNISAGWQAFATQCGGRYANIDQNRAAQQSAIKTEFDKDILELNNKLNSTYVAYGEQKERESKAQNQSAQDANAAKASPEAALARASSKAGGLYRNSNWDLVDRMKDDKDFDISKIKDEDLCDELRKLKPEERVAFIKKKAEEREAIQKQIAELSAKRAKKVQEEVAKQPKSPGDKALDEALKSTLQEQAKAKGFEVPAEKK